MQGPNYTAQRLPIRVDQQWFYPEKRYYWGQKTIHTETALHISPLSHLLLMVLDDQPPLYGVRLQYKPFINALWMGVGLMVLGGWIAFSQRYKKLALVLLFCPSMAYANSDQRAYDLCRQVLCPVCVGQTIADSQTTEAVVLRQEIHQKILEGQSNEEILQELQQRYGQNILRDAKHHPFLIWLWALPWALLIGALSVMVLRYKKHQKHK